LAADSIDVICGPTAAGKSAIAMTLAQSDKVAIISADSRQIYRGFDIGTAKPTPQEREAVPHYGIDVVSGGERYSAAAWAEGAKTWIARARANGRTPIIVGGTGFYIRALIDPLFEEPELDTDRRAALTTFLDSLTTLELRRWCQALDRERAGLGRTQLLRAIEIPLLTGRRLSELHRLHARPMAATARYLLVDPGPPLADRIEKRVHRMLEAGWLDEVRRLATEVPPSAPAWNATGYREVHRLVRGECAEAETIRRIVVATRQYAKRQRTWFRHQLPADAVTTINPDDASAGDFVQSWWAQRTRAA
jgi:tRNA dimethylallyltransferase